MAMKSLSYDAPLLVPSLNCLSGCNLIQLYVSDIDECDLLIDTCHDDAECVDSIGSFVCHCNEGFTGNGVDCSGKELCHIALDASMDALFLPSDSTLHIDECGPITH